MAQDSTELTRAALTDEQIKAGIIRPYDKVKFEFSGSPYHKDGDKEDIHPQLAKVLVSKGLGKIIDTREDTSGTAEKTTEAEMKQAKEKAKAEAKAKADAEKEAEKK